MGKRKNRSNRRLLRMVSALLMATILLTACGSGETTTEENQAADSELVANTAAVDAIEAEAVTGQEDGSEEGTGTEQGDDSGQESGGDNVARADEGKTDQAEQPQDQTAVEASEAEDGPEPLNIPVWVTSSNVNLRAEPGTDSEVQKKLGRNAKLTLRYEENGWGAVEDEEMSGFVSLEYLTREEPSANAFVVVIDPGHQRKGDSTPEPNGPESSTMKARVTGGPSGRTTGVMEYELTLAVSLKLRDELEARGYTVCMTRETHDVNISNMERAQYATSAGADVAVRIHANGVEDSTVSGALALTPSASNPYISHLAEDSQRLSQCILDAYCDATGMRNQGVVTSDTMTGINWSTVPVTILEMGYMTNPSDDTNMEDEAYQEKMIQGIADGIDGYFGIG